MKKIRFTLYGFLIGAVCAVCGSAIFVLVLQLLTYQEMILEMDWVIAESAVFFLFSVICSAVPGATGGAYLARWLEKSDRIQKEIKWHGMIVGAIAGLGASLLAIVLISVILRESPYDSSVLILIGLALFVSTLIGQLGSSIMSKRLKRSA